MEDTPINDLFICTDYTIQTFKYKDFTQDLYSLNSASTDYDLTGQVIWSAAHLLSRYIIDHPEQFKDKHILELGSGAGLSGLVGSHFARSMILTDYQDIVLDLLEKNKSFGKNVQIEKFLWGEHEALDKKISHLDMIIGSDVIFWPDCIRPLISSLKYFIDKYQVSILIAARRRAISIENQVFDTCQSLGLGYEIILKENDDILMNIFKQ